MAERRDRMDDHTGDIQANMTNIEVDLIEDGDSGRSTGDTSGRGLGSVERLSNRPGGEPSPAHLGVEQRDQLRQEILRMEARLRSDDPVDSGRPSGGVGVVRQHAHILPPTAGHKKPVATPDRYDGSSPWTSYQRHFELCAQINTWDECAKAHFLAVSLKGRAQQVLSNLAPWQLGDYATMVGVLKSRFDPEGREELYRIQLRNRRQGPKESLVEMAQDIRNMVDRAYGEMAEQSKDSLAKEYFLDALPEADIRTRVLQMRPASLQRAVQDAIELEAINRAERERSSRAPPLQRVRTLASPEDSLTTTARSVRPDKAAEDNAIAELTKSLKDLKTEMNTHGQKMNKLCTERDAQSKDMAETLRRAVSCLSEIQRQPPPGPWHNNRPQEGRRDGNRPRYNPNSGEGSRVPTRQTGNDNRCYGCGEEGHFRRECPRNQTGN